MNAKNQELSELLEESIKVEISVADLYSLYTHIFEEDKDFWWRMSNEEKNHAALLKSGRLYLQQDILPMDLLYHGLSTLEDINRQLNLKIEEWKKTAPSKETAYQYALELEESASELHFQKILETEKLADSFDSKVLTIFKNLALGDKDHAIRIRVLMDGLGLGA